MDIFWKKNVARGVVHIVKHAVVESESESEVT